MHKLYRIRSLTNRERNFWDSFPADLAETKGTLKCTMICLPKVYVDATTRDWIWWSVKIPLIGTAWNHGLQRTKPSNFLQDNPKNFITVPLSLLAVFCKLCSRTLHWTNCTAGIRHTLKASATGSKALLHKGTSVRHLVTGDFGFSQVIFSQKKKKIQICN